MLQSSSLGNNVAKLGTNHQGSGSTLNAEDLCGLIGVDCSVFMALAALGFELNADSIAELVGKLEEMVADATSDAKKTKEEGKTYSYAVKKAGEVAKMAVSAGEYGLKAVDFTQKAWKRLWSK